MSFNCAAPFRERLSACRLSCKSSSVMLQLCRSLSGAVIIRKCWNTCLSLIGFNCAAPFRERLLLETDAYPQPFKKIGFNCAAPFRERLSCPRRDLRQLRQRASIVPLPFGSGYFISGALEMLTS